MKKAFKNLIKKAVGIQGINSLLSLIIYCKKIYYSYGNNVECPICKHTYDRFLTFKNRSNALCPYCRSLERHRLLYLFLINKTDFFTSNIRVLHFAPEKCLAKVIRTYKNITYTTADLMASFIYDIEVKPDYQMSVTDIKFDFHSFDVVICNHVLEHVPDDRLAMREIHRVLKPNGYAILQVPINGTPTTFEDQTLAIEQRDKLYGTDHVRYYGFDYKDRLEESGFDVEVSNYVQELDKVRYRLNAKERIYICYKNNKT